MYLVASIVCGLLLICLLAAASERATRWWFRRRSGYYVFPPGLRLRLYPDRDLFPELEAEVRFDVNSAGERGHEVPRLAAHETLYRVLVAGGSQPEGYLLDQDTQWPGALQCLLSSPAHLEALGASKVHVGNIGRSGVGSEALEIILNRVLPRYSHLQAIVVLVGASDVLRWLEQGAPPSAPSPGATPELFRWHPEQQFGWKPEQCALLELGRRLRQRWLRPVEVHRRAGQWYGRATAMRARAKIIRTSTPTPAPMLDNFERHFRNVIRTAKAHADRVVVVRQSWLRKDSYSSEESARVWHGGIGQAWREEISAYYSAEVSSMLMTMLDDRAARIASELEVEQIDLPSILEASLRTYYDWFHLTPLGASAVATAVADVLVQPPAISIRFQDFENGDVDAGSERQQRVS